MFVLQPCALNAMTMSQAVIRAVCVIIDAFHFPVAAADETAATERGDAEAQTDRAVDEALDLAADNKDGEGESASEAGDVAAESAEAAKEIQASLVRRVLPALQAQLVRSGTPAHVASGSTVL
jgi:U3 small nucleolar RNA-associated protein 20